MASNRAMYSSTVAASHSNPDHGPAHQEAASCGRLRYTKATGQWSLYWRDRNLRFHVYDRIMPSPHIDELLQEIDRDPTAIFWG